MAIVGLAAVEGGQHLQHQPGEKNSNPGKSTVSNLDVAGLVPASTIATTEFSYHLSPTACLSGFSGHLPQRTDVM